MNTSQDAILSAIAQHASYSYRLSSGEVNKLISLFNGESNAMVSKLRDLLDELSDAERVALSGGQYTTPLLQEIRGIFATWQSTLSTALPEAFAVSATALAVHEAAFAAKIAGESIRPNGEKLYKAAKKIPVVGGALLDELFNKIKDDARLRVEYAIRQGITDGWTNQQIVQRIKGKKALNYQDGILQQSRGDIERVVRTSRSHVANTAYMDTYKAVGFTHVKFVSTLDGRTSATCMHYSDRVYKIDEAHPRPPLHPNCRSVLVGVDADGKLPGKRPFVSDSRPVRDIPKAEREGKIGQVSANTTFKEWFNRQDKEFQREWLGEKRFKLFTEGGYSLEKFTDPIGRKYTLNELRELDEKTFKNLGI